MTQHNSKGLVLDEPLIFEKSCEGRFGVEPPRPDVSSPSVAVHLPKKFLRSGIPGFPQVSEMDVVRHYTRLSTWNFGVDTGFYPLGSCTMKYNPKINETACRLPGFAHIHPYEPLELVQGALELMYDLEGYLAEISGMDGVTLQPSAGAHGELCGLLMMAAYFKAKGRPRRRIIIPDTAHGTNPASAHLAGFSVIPIKSEGKGVISVEAVKAAMDRDTAGIMLTNPNTLGLFERNIKEIAGIVHKKGGLVYCDGANLNAIMGLVKLGDIGVDVVQFNLHKTFSTPHGGGGPGSGPVGVKKALEPFLPVPRIRKVGAGKLPVSGIAVRTDRKVGAGKKALGKFTLAYDRPRSIGRLKAFYGNFGVMVRAYAYIRRMGGDGLKKAAETAILNANYVKERLKDTYHLAYDEPCMHEVVFSDKHLTQYGVSTMDVAKRLIDYGFHPPTVYFPLVVHGAIMIEPTETETLKTLDRFVDAMKKIAEEAKTDPEILKNAPSNTKIGRVDETKAAREPVLRWRG